jgi:hypothetical protein
MPDAGRPSSNLLVPTIRVASVPEIHLETLRSLGIKGLIFDLDDTLVHAIEPRAHPEMMAWIEAIRAEFKIYIVSNNPRRDRVELAALHLDLPFHHAAKKPSRRFFRAALEVATKRSCDCRRPIVYGRLGRESTGCRHDSCRPALARAQMASQGHAQRRTIHAGKPRYNLLYARPTGIVPPKFRSLFRIICAGFNSRTPTPSKESRFDHHHNAFCR